ncbi:MAG: hypothetical protein ACXWLM_13630 [Myxococcales bacterium]
MSRMFVLILIAFAGAARAEGPLHQLSSPPPPPPSVETADTLIEGNVTNGGYLAPRIAYGQVAGRDAVFVGGEGGWIINHSFILGCAGSGLVTQQRAPGDYGITDDLSFGYGGVMLGYTFLPARLVHGTFTTVVGAGGIGSHRRSSTHASDLQDAVFVLEPTATFELNMVQHVRAGVAISYRWVRGVETAGLSNSDLSGVLGSLVVKFGKF